ncbi:Protein of unknown function [Gryllus bimaculatus]|nr:Protein of unknown function [Gryllus bimaculatus]
MQSGVPRQYCRWQIFSYLGMFYFIW